VILLLGAVPGCGPLGAKGTGWADLPLAGVSQEDEIAITRLQVEPASFAGQTVRTSVRVVDAQRDPEGVFLFLVPRGAPLEASSVRLLVPAGRGGEEFLDLRGRDLVLVMRVEDVRSIVRAHDAAVIDTPLSHVSLFGSASTGGEAAEAARERLELDAPTEAQPASP
jgi:hypothetical protein